VGNLCVHHTCVRLFVCLCCRAAVSQPQPVRQPHSSVSAAACMHAVAGVGVWCIVQVMSACQQCSDCVHVCRAGCVVCAAAVPAVQHVVGSCGVNGVRARRPVVKGGTGVCEHTASGRAAVAVRRCPRRCFWRLVWTARCCWCMFGLGAAQNLLARTKAHGRCSTVLHWPHGLVYHQDATTFPQARLDLSSSYADQAEIL
jgi:hypothetical protein